MSKHTKQQLIDRYWEEFLLNRKDFEVVREIYVTMEAFWVWVIENKL